MSQKIKTLFFLTLLLAMGCSATPQVKEGLTATEVNHAISFVRSLGSHYKIQKIVQISPKGVVSKCYIKASSDDGLKTFVLTNQGLFEEKKNKKLLVVPGFKKAVGKEPKGSKTGQSTSFSQP